MQKMTFKDKGSYESTPPCAHLYCSLLLCITQCLFVHFFLLCKTLFLHYYAIHYLSHRLLCRREKWSRLHWERKVTARGKNYDHLVYAYFLLYIYMCIYIWYMYAHTYLHVYIYMYTYTSIYIHTYIYICIHIYVYICMNTYIHIHIYIYIYIYTHIFIHIYTYMCIHTYVYV